MTDQELHALEKEYNLTRKEILDALSRRFRAKVTLEGVVAEYHLGKMLRRLKRQGVIRRYEEHDQDGYPDYTIWLPDPKKRPLRIECKNVRDSDEAYRKNGEVYAYKVETQKTRTSQGDASSRYYDFTQFDVLAVCLGKKTHNWKQFHFIRSRKLDKHNKYPHKMAVMHKVPLPTSIVQPPWYTSLDTLIMARK
jgi:hypothetical protein